MKAKHPQHIDKAVSTPFSKVKASASGARNRKHKASPMASRSKSKRRKTTKKPAKPFPFLVLPGELRNLVYEHVAQQQTAILDKGLLTDSSGLLDINEHIANEYYPILLLCAGTIQANVKTFDFRTLVTFINKLSDAELRALPGITAASSRKFSIILHIYQRLEKPDGYGLLRRWLNRAGHATKKGTKLDMSYSLGLVKNQTTRPINVADVWYRMLEGYERRESYNERTTEEVKKIKAAISVPH